MEINNKELKEIRENIACPQFGDDHYGPWGCLSMDLRRTVKRMIDYIAGQEEVINHQRAEIERLQDENKYLRFYIGIKTDEQFKDIIAKTETTESHIKADAIKEFVSELMKKAGYESYSHGRTVVRRYLIDVDCFENIVKEKVGDGNG